MPRDTRHVADLLLQIGADKHQHRGRDRALKEEARGIAKCDEPWLQKARKKRGRGFDEWNDEPADRPLAEARPIDHEKRNSGDKQRGEYRQEIDDAAQPDPVPDVVLNTGTRSAWIHGMRCVADCSDLVG